MSIRQSAELDGGTQRQISARPVKRCQRRLIWNQNVSCCAPLQSVHAHPSADAPPQLPASPARHLTCNMSNIEDNAGLLQLHRTARRSSRPIPNDSVHMHDVHAYSIPGGWICSELLVSGLDLAAARSAATASRFRATCRSICCSAASARCWQCFCNACTCRQYNVAMQQNWLQGMMTSGCGRMPMAVCNHTRCSSPETETPGTLRSHCCASWRHCALASA